MRFSQHEIRIHGHGQDLQQNKDLADNAISLAQKLEEVSKMEAVARGHLQS
jgi:hypothetical protein